MENRRKRNINDYLIKHSIWGYFLFNLLNPKKWWKLWRTNEMRYFFLGVYGFIIIFLTLKVVIILFG